jgi:hypothetical protein
MVAQVERLRDGLEPHRMLGKAGTSNVLVTLPGASTNRSQPIERRPPSRSRTWQVRVRGPPPPRAPGRAGSATAHR